MAFVQVKTFSKALHKKTDIQVILPTPLASEVMDGAMASQFERNSKSGAGLNYYAPELRCPVLYLLHGTYGDDGDWMRFSRIESYAQNYNVAVVMADAENSCYRDMPRGGPGYYTYFTEELPTMMKWMFPISDKREDTFIAGLSMGGSGAMKIDMSRPDLFSHVACLSGGFRNLNEKAESDDSVWSMAFKPHEDLSGTIDDLPWLLSQQVEKKVELPKLYVCCGTADFIYDNTVEMRGHLDRLKIPYEYHEQEGAVHNWDFWDDEIQRILEWLPLQRR